MLSNFSIYQSPFSDETIKLRRNAVLSSAVCLFIGLTEELPSKFSLLGISFESTEKQVIAGWFLLSVSAYIFLHFISYAFVEIAKWLHPLIKHKIYKSGLLKHPAFDDTDFMPDYIFIESNEQDKNLLSQAEDRNADAHTFKRLTPLYAFIYLRLAIEIFVPVFIGVFGLYKLWEVIAALS